MVGSFVRCCCYIKMHHELLVDQYNWILIYLVVGWEGNVLANELKTTFIIFFMWRPHKNPGFKTEICAPMYNILAICICIIMCVYIYSKICLKRFKPIWQPCWRKSTFFNNRFDCARGLGNTTSIWKFVPHLVSLNNMQIYHYDRFAYSFIEIGH